MWWSTISSMEKYHYTPTTYTYHGSYVRNSKAVGVLWAVFTICFAIINVLVFFQPYWLGSSEKSPGAGVFGLYQYCTYDRTSEMSIEKCSGELSSFENSVLTVYFKAATILIGVSALIILLCIACMLLFFFVSARTVYILCGCLQFTSCKCFYLVVSLRNWLAG